MSVTTPDLFEEVVASQNATKVMLMENEQYVAQPLHIEENLVVGEEIVVGDDDQVDIMTYLEQSLKSNREMIDEEPVKDSTLPNNDQVQNVFFKEVLENDEMDIEETVADPTASPESSIDENYIDENYIDEKQEECEDMLIEEEENSETQGKQQKVIVLDTSDGEQLFIFYQSNSENEGIDDETNIDPSNLHFVTEEEEEEEESESVDNESTDAEQKSEQFDIMHLEESEVTELSEALHKTSEENEQMNTKNGFIIDTPLSESQDNCTNEDQTDQLKISPALAYYFPGDMSYNDVSQSISLLKSKKEKCEKDSDKSPLEVDHQQTTSEQTDEPRSSSSTTEAQVSTTAEQVNQCPQGRRRPRKQKLLDRGDDEMVFVPKWKVEAEEQTAYRKRCRPRGRHVKKSHISKRNMHLEKLRMKKRMKAKRKIEIIDLTGDDGGNDEDKENEIITINSDSDNEKEEQEKRPVKRKRIRRRRKYTCKHCSETFTMVTALARHVKTIHLHKRTRRRRIKYYQKSKTKP